MAFLKSDANCDNLYVNTQDFTEKDPLNKKNIIDTRKIVETSFSKNCAHALQHITFEPTMLLFVIHGVLQVATTQNLCLQKACGVNLNFTDEVCALLKLKTGDSFDEREMQVQKLFAASFAWKSYITAPVPVVLALFAGSYSDKTGHRKLFVLLPIIGQSAMTINNILNKYYFYQLNVEFLVFSESVIEGISGGWCLCMMTMFAYVSVITTLEERTFRLGLLNFCFTVGFPLGVAVSGYIIKNYGIYGGYTAASILQVINLFYNIVFIKDPKRTVEQKQHDKKGFCHFVRTFFDIRNVRDTIVVVFKNDSNNRRCRIITLLIVVSILFGPIIGEISVLYLQTRYRFNWDEVQFSLFQSYNFILHTIGTIFSITVFSKYLKWHDSMLGIISTVSKIAASFVYCFAPNEKIFYIGPAVEILNGTSLLALRSIVSKLVEQSELGKVNSIFALTENLMPLVYVPVYTKVYSSTMEVLPGAVFLVGSFMTLPAVVVFMWLFIEHRMSLGKKKKLEHSQEEHAL